MWSMNVIRTWKLGLLVLGGWAIAPNAWANPTEITAPWIDIAPQTEEVEKQLAPEPLPATTVKDWMAQIEAVQVQITGVQWEETASGLQVILETNGQTLATPITTVEGTVLTAQIPNAVLALPDSEAFEVADPASGIAQVQVTNMPGDQVQIVITGTEAPPMADIQTEKGSVVVRVTPEKTSSEDLEEALEITVTATRTETAAQDVPQAIQVIPQEVIKKRQVNDLTDALRVIPGINSSLSTSLFNNVNIRGFSADFRRNGLRDSTVGSSAIQTANIERIEVLKGPASVLYGSGSFGGTVNILTKQPTDEPLYRFDAAIGNFDLYRGAVDLSGPINKSGTVKYRLNVAGETEGSFIDAVGRKRLLVAPVLSWEIDQNTDITFELEYTNLTADNNFGLPARGTVLENINGDIDRSLNIGAPGREKREIDTITVGYNFEHRFSDNWRIRNSFQFARRTAPEFTVSGINLLDDQRTLERDYVDVPRFDSNAYLLDTYLIGNFNTGPVKHEMLVGVELFQGDGGGPFSFGIANSIDLFTPDNNTLILEEEDSLEDKTTNKNLGIYLQDKIEVLDNLILLLGGRFDIAGTQFEDITFGTSDSQTESEFSPRLGIVYKPISDLSLYASYSRSFIPNFFDRNIDGEIFPPQRGTQFEVGTKVALTDKFSVNVAYFDISIANVPTSDLDNPAFSIITGEQSSKGVELFASGEILPGWNLIGGYTYNDAKITQDNDIPVGNRIPNNPKHALSLSTTYELQKGDLKGLGFGLGIFFVGKRQGDFDNSFEVPSYTRTDASIFYNRGKFRAALNFKNLFNVNYFENVESDLRVRFGAPFTVIGSISFEL